ncbi:MAG: hypothetical protein ACXVO9_01365 [Bacteroidia bacterium]
MLNLLRTFNTGLKDIASSDTIYPLIDYQLKTFIDHLKFVQALSFE